MSLKTVDGYPIVTVADLIEFLQGLDPSMEVSLDKDGWYIDRNTKSTQEVIDQSGLFLVLNYDGGPGLLIQN